MKSVKLTLTLEQAQLLERLLNRDVKGMLQEIDHAEYSREFRDRLRHDYDNLAAIRDKLGDACRESAAGSAVSIVIIEDVGHQAM